MQNTCYDSVNAIVDSLALELNHRGILCDEINVSQDREKVLEQMNVIEQGKYDVAI
ncbi:hypothetical protein [Butyrivibrio proteoclasticus]|uniref:hypothetical protein n=1 Tax=Butyrivibrio proteoclasticus TaxID=43305 RepID=UPI0015A51E9E|nr:hypothetical protein [Butyrivibrio proteoclasticus]